MLSFCSLRAISTLGFSKINKKGGGFIKNLNKVLSSDSFVSFSSSFFTSTIFSMIMINFAIFFYEIYNLNSFEIFFFFPMITFFLFPFFYHYSHYFYYYYCYFCCYYYYYFQWLLIPVAFYSSPQITDSSFLKAKPLSTSLLISKTNKALRSPNR